MALNLGLGIMGNLVSNAQEETTGYEGMDTLSQDISKKFTVTASHMFFLTLSPVGVGLLPCIQILNTGPQDLVAPDKEILMCTK